MIPARKLFVFSFLLFVPFYVCSADKTKEQSVVELLDGFCIESDGNYELFELFAEALGAEDVSGQIMDPNMIRGDGGKSFLVTYESKQYLAGFINNGGCSIFSKNLDAKVMGRLIQKNFQMTKPTRIDSTATTIVETYLIGRQSVFAAGGIVTLTYSKPDTEWDFTTVGYLHPRFVDKIRDSN